MFFEVIVTIKANIFVKMDPNTRLQQATNGLIASLAQSHLRPLHKKAFKCSADCCDRFANASHEAFQGCVSECQRAPAQAEQVLSTELQSFQQRIQRCAMDCKDRAQDKLPPDASKQTPQLMQQLEAEVHTCVNSCVDQNITALKQVESRFKASLANF